MPRRRARRRAGRRPGPPSGGGRSADSQRIIEAYTELIEGNNGSGSPTLAVRHRAARSRSRLPQEAGRRRRPGGLHAGAVARAGGRPATVLAGKAWNLLGRKELADRLFERAFRKASAPDEVAYALAHHHEGCTTWKGPCLDGKVAAPSIREMLRATLLNDSVIGRSRSRRGGVDTSGSQERRRLYDSGNHPHLSEQARSAREVLLKASRWPPRILTSFKP